MFLYVVKHGAVLGISGGLLTVKYPDKSEEAFPKNTIEGIAVFSKVTITTACIEFCLMNNINVGFFSLNGRYYGRLTPVVNTNVTNLRKQIALSTDESYILKIARRIIHAKISNQLVVANRYSSNASDLMEIKNEVKRLKRKVVNAESINQLIGFEGLASKYYFKALSKVIVNDFAFNGRNRRPAVDSFNCMLNLG